MSHDPSTAESSATTPTVTAQPSEKELLDADSSRALYLPWGVRMAAAWSGSMILIAGGVYLIIRVFQPVMGVAVIPVMVALLLAALLKPIHNTISKVMNPMLAAVLTSIGSITVVIVLLSVVGNAVAGQFGLMTEKAQAGYHQFIDWINSGPFGLDAEKFIGVFDQAVSQLLDQIRSNIDNILSGTLTAAQAVTSLLVGTVMAIFLLLFFLSDGARIRRWLVHLFPKPARMKADGATIAAWDTLGSYVRVQVIVAGIDAFGIAIGAALLGVPLWLPIGVLVFFGSFVPIVGAMVTGIVAALVALVTNGPVTALLMIAVVLLVQQIESNVLQPILMGRAVSLHPVAVVLAVAVGSTLLGIFGAVIAVPIAAVVNRVGSYLANPQSPTEVLEDGTSSDDLALIAKRIAESTGAQQLRKVQSRLRRNNELTEKELAENNIHVHDERAGDKEAN